MSEELIERHAKELYAKSRERIRALEDCVRELRSEFRAAIMCDFAGDEAHESLARSLELVPEKGDANG